MEYLIQYGMFLAKAATIVVSIVLVIGAIAAAGSRQRRASKRGGIVIERLNDHLEDLHDAVREEVIDPATLKLDNKARSKREKEEAKAETKRAKAEAKDKAKEKAKEKTKPKDESSQTTNAAITENKSSNDAHLDDAPSRRKRVYVLDFDGDVAAEEVSSLREEITTVLSIAEPCDEIILKLESPGGMVHAYGLASSQLLRIKSKQIPLTICVDKVAASGGYMMACLADRLISAPFAIIGSIGVLVQLPNFHRVLKKNEVDYEIISAGEFKRTLTQFGEITQKGRDKVQEEVETMHDIFKAWIKEHRPSVEIDKIATGETWVGTQAKERYMVDEIKTSDDCIVSACEEADVYEVEYELPKSLQDKIGGALQGTVEKLLSNWIGKSTTTTFQ